MMKQLVFAVIVTLSLSVDPLARDNDPQATYDAGKPLFDSGPLDEVLEHFEVEDFEQMGVPASRLSDSQTTSTISGYVVDAEGYVAGARVRVRATDNMTFTDEEGQFELEVIEGEEVELTAWADGYYIAFTHVAAPAADVELKLRPYHTQDHPDYQWQNPVGKEETGESGACSTCHPMIIAQWQENAHGMAVSNERFFSLYSGTNLDGSRVVEPGYVLDFSNTAGTCANCHAPGAAVDGYLTTRMETVRDAVTAGIHCDYCHKIGGVYLNPATENPYPNTPGVQSQRVLRPPEDDNIFFGPYDDIHDPDTYLPQISESAFCAPCHQFSMWGTPIYESYNEWLASPYAASNTTCQDCHMPPTGDVIFALPEAGGLEHPAEDIPSHLQRGALDVELLQNTVTMRLEVEQNRDQLIVTAAITNTEAGHHVPTDFPGRHLLLTIQAVDDRGRFLSLIGGETVPEYGGPQMGLPGKIFAKILRDVNTGTAPVVSYWNQTQIFSDNRIPALQTDTSRYIFSLSDAASVQITADLIFRRVFYPVAESREWDTPDIPMERVTQSVSVE